MLLGFGAILRTNPETGGEGGGGGGGEGGGGGRGVGLLPSHA